MALIVVSTGLELVFNAAAATARLSSLCSGCQASSVDFRFPPVS